jgi:hypothetical protein
MTMKVTAKKTVQVHEFCILFTNVVVYALIYMEQT